MVPDNAVAPSFSKGGAVDHIGHGPVMADKIKIDRSKIIKGMAKIPDKCNRL